MRRAKAESSVAGPRARCGLAAVLENDQLPDQFRNPDRTEVRPAWPACRSAARRGWRSCAVASAILAEECQPASVGVRYVGGQSALCCDGPRREPRRAAAVRRNRTHFPNLTQRPDVGPLDSAPPGRWTRLRSTWRRTAPVVSLAGRIVRPPVKSSRAMCLTRSQRSVLQPIDERRHAVLEADLRIKPRISLERVGSASQRLMPRAVAAAAVALNSRSSPAAMTPVASSTVIDRLEARLIVVLARFSGSNARMPRTAFETYSFQPPAVGGAGLSPRRAAVSGHDQTLAPRTM